MSFRGSTLHYKRLLVVIKQTAYEEYSQLKLRGQAPKALRWKRLESRYKTHKQTVNDLLGLLRHHKAEFSCVNRVDLDRQHLVDVDLVIAVGGDGTVLSSAHFLDNGTIPLLGINSDPITLEERFAGVKKSTDERRSHGALCMCTSLSMHKELPKVLHGEAKISSRTRILCVVKSTFSETRLVPALNDILISNPCPAAVSRFRMGWLKPTSDEPPLDEFFQNLGSNQPRDCLRSNHYGFATRFSGVPYDVCNSINVWSSGLWVCTSTGSSAATHSAGGKIMDISTPDLQYLIREHMIEEHADEEIRKMNNGYIHSGDQVYIRWNSQRGKIFIDGSHLAHNLELGDEILINNSAPPLQLFTRDDNE